MKKLVKILTSIFVIPLGIIIGLIAAIIVGLPFFPIYACDILIGQIWGYSNGKPTNH